MKIAIIGAGALGSALAINFAKNDNIKEIILWNRKLRGMTAPSIQSTDQLINCQKAHIIFITISSQGLEEILYKISKIDFIFNPYFILCTKGINDDGTFLHEMAINILRTKNIMLMLGPSFAKEITEGEPTYVNLIFPNIIEVQFVIDQLTSNSSNLKMSPLTDYFGAQICSIMKNIAALYLGILHGMGVKNNLSAAFFTFFIKEIKLLIEFYGGNIETLWELCGIGDLFLTCTSFKSRNYSFGYKIGTGEGNLENQYPEGYYALANLLKLRINLPLSQKLYEVIYLKKDIKLLINNLLQHNYT